jgi:hypothetical protein
MPRFGFANRKLALTLYMSYDIEPYEELKSLGKHKIGKGCLYIRRLCDVNMDVLKQLIVKASNDVLKHDFITLMDEES